MKKIALLSVLICIATLSFAQDNFRQKFLEANTLMEESSYNVALPIWLKLSIEDPDNFNINYKIGICYMNSANEKAKALDYLIKASQNTTSNYDPFSHSEKSAPLEALFYVARAYHLNYEFDAAIMNYNTFKGKITKKHYLFNEIDRYLTQAQFAKEAVANPVNILLKNIGSEINSEYADYSPVISIDESSIYFTSRRLRPDSSNYYITDDFDGKHFEDIYVSHSYDGVWTAPELLTINTDGHLATVNISADGQTLFVYRDDDGDGNIYTTTKNENDQWGELVKLGSDINTEYKESHAHITPDGNVLYFISDRKKGGLGGQDIYFCKKLPTGDWGLAQNAGNILNTPYDEDGIFLHPDGKTIYFSSKGHSSMGGFDIFYSELDETGNWGTPKNMGYPVNSTDDDVFFVTSTDGKRAYYSSFKQEGLGEKDIYVITLVDAQEKPLTLLTGFLKVAGFDETPESAIIIVTDNETGDLVGRYVPRKKDGKFSIILNPGGDYHIEYAAESYTMEEDIYIPPISAYNEINRGIDLKDVVFGDVQNTDTKNDIKTDTKTDTKTDNKEDVVALKNEVKNLKKQIKDLENQLAKKPTTTNTTTGDDSEKVKELQKEVNTLKNQIAELKKQGNNNDFTPTPTEVKDAVAHYQEFFNYNVSKVNTANAKYIDMINKAVAHAKSNGKVTIDIESSASKVPTKTHGSNAKLAYKRAIAAQEVVVNSLISKGIAKENIIVNNVTTGVQGPNYNGDFANKKMYEQYQFVIIKIK
ncbi:MAG TPA: hypothetical protein VIN73_00715 [Vicingaceae bacterium]